MAWDVLSWATKMAWDVLFGVTKTAWDVLTRVANRSGMFCLGCQKMAWHVLSQDVLYYICFIRQAVKVLINFLDCKQLGPRSALPNLDQKIVSEYDQEIPQS